MTTFRLKYLLILTFSYINLLGERLWNCFWPVTTIILAFIALSLLNIPLLFGLGWQLVVLGVFVLAAAGAFWRGGGRFFFPSRADVERRIEETSILDHRPLEALKDQPIEGLSAKSLALWQKHLQKAAASISCLKIYKPQTTVAAQDRWALRHAAVIFLVLGGVVAQDDALPRLHQTFTPDLEVLLTQKAVSLDLWISPPEYTHQPAIFLSTAKQGVIAREDMVKIPQGSMLKLRLSGYRFAPRLHYGDQRYPLTEITTGNYTFEMPLQQNGLLKLDYWLQHIGRWQIHAQADTAPEISILQTEKTPQAALKVFYKSYDDHGITKITGIITPSPETAEKLGNKTTYFDISLPHTAKTTHVEDLTAHFWAGLPVTLTLEVEDALGHKSTSAPYALILPERVFTNPIAQRLIEERKSLLWTKNILNLRAVAANLAEIANQPGIYKDDIITFMSLSAAIKRLMYDPREEAVESVQELLWDIALKFEDGGLSLAQRELRNSLQKMSEALNDKNLSQQQLQDLLDDVRQKMQQYIQTLAAEMQQRAQQGKKLPVLSPELAQKFMKNIDLSKMLEQMKQLSQANSRENLQKMADQLRNAVDNLDMKKFDEMQEKQMQAMEALQNIEEIIHRQQSLFDKTNKSADPDDLTEQKHEQSAIRRELGGALRQLGEVMDPIPENFTAADQAMKKSEEALARKSARESLPQQKAALDELQKGLDSTLQQMAESMQQSILSFGMPPNGGNMGAGFDPLGRSSGIVDDDSIKLPSEKEQRRVQEIIEELRHRSNEPNRTKVERDYIDRLLDQF